MTTDSDHAEPNWLAHVRGITSGFVLSTESISPLSINPALTAVWQIEALSQTGPQMFGKRVAPAARSIERPPIDSDGKRRVFGEDVFFNPKHGKMLSTLGFDINDSFNIIPDDAEFDRRVEESLAKQDARRTQIETDLLRIHGHNAIRPFFILAEPVFNGALGHWLIRLMNLLPYDDWNVVYLPLDRATQVAMGGTPLHPLQSIGPIDELMCKQIGGFHSQFRDARQKIDQHVQKVGLNAANDAIAAFVAYADALPQRILGYVAEVRTMIVALIADVQSKAGRA